ncbi:MAG TPA: anti-sigma factor [Streptosporangiaceae bacterium]|nr:anti-sigma factor [Streptosporangiaceae bacterium]
MKQELHALVGAYAVDALDDIERRRFEDHLAECESCARETRGLREAAAQLGTAVAMPPPPRLREKVMADVARVRPLPPLPPLLSDVRSRRSRTPWLLMAATVACLVAVAGFMGVLTVRAQDRADRAEAAGRQIIEVLSAPDARRVSGRASTSGSGTVVASRAQGKAVVVLSGVPSLPGSQTYELWLMGPGKPRPAGLLRGSGTPVIAAGLGDATQVGVTVEPAGGSPQPTSVPVLTIALPA